MSTAILNIGLNVEGREDVKQLSKTISLTAEYEIIFNVKVVQTKGDGAERTVVVEIENSMGEHYFKDLLKMFCRVLNQDYITYKTSQGKLGIVFTEGYDGEVVEFIEEYFLTF